MWTKFRSACNKTFGWNQLGSHNKVKHVRKKVLPISRSEWEELKVSLYKNKQGKNVREPKEINVLIVENFKNIYLSWHCQNQNLKVN